VNWHTFGQIVWGKATFGKRFHMADRFVAVMSDLGLHVEVIDHLSQAASGLPILLDNRGFVVWILPRHNL
jgi:hypothetical protein